MAHTKDLENAAEIALTAFCWWRADLPADVCETYWRDVHGIMFARVPGLWQYRQLRLAANRPELWPAVEGVSFDAPAGAQPRGIPHALFLSEADLTAFGNHPLARETIPNDTCNFIGRIGAQLSPPGSGRTLVDSIDEPALEGPPPVPTFVVCFVPKDETGSVEAFHRYLIEHVARVWSADRDVLRLRVEPLPRYDQTAMRSPGVPHEWPNGETYLGWIELAVRDDDVIGSLPARLDTAKLAAHVKTMHTYPVREVYTIVSAGRPTEVGLRGYPAVRTIAAAGAENQRSEAVLESLFGTAIRGRDRLGRS